jgi:hypothetical protein
MAQGDVELLPPNDGDETKTQNITIYNYIKLVNQTSTLPDGTALNSYSVEDKTWIKERVNFEQEQRIALINKLVDHKHALDRDDQERGHRSQMHRQYAAAALIGIAVIAAAILIANGFGILAIGLVAILIAPGLAGVIMGGITGKLKDIFTIKSAPSDDSGSSK